MANKYIQQFDLPYIHNVQCYEKLMKIGQGTFGLVAAFAFFLATCCRIFSEVFKARCKKSGRLVALKKILMENEREGVSFAIFERRTLLAAAVSDHSYTRSQNASAFTQAVHH